MFDIRAFGCFLERWHKSCQHIRLQNYENSVRISQTDTAVENLSRQHVQINQLKRLSLYGCLSLTFFTRNRIFGQTWEQSSFCCSIYGCENWLVILKGREQRKRLRTTVLRTRDISVTISSGYKQALRYVIQPFKVSDMSQFNNGPLLLLLCLVFATQQHNYEPTTRSDHQQK